MMATLSWYFIISWEIFISINYAFKPQWMEKRYFFHIFVWCLSLIVASIPIGHYYLQPDTGTCWFEGLYLHQFAVFIPFTLYLAFAAILLCIVIYNLRSTLSGRKGKIIMLRTGVFVGVFVITWFSPWLW